MELVIVRELEEAPNSVSAFQASISRWFADRFGGSAMSAGLRASFPTHGVLQPGQSREVGRVLARAFAAQTVQAVVHVPFIDRTGVVRSKPFTVPGSF